VLIRHSRFIAFDIDMLCEDVVHYAEKSVRKLDKQFSDIHVLGRHVA
jgi:hypothetical protein